MAIELKPPPVETYPQLCGLCGCNALGHTPDRCKLCNHQHAYVRTDVLQCTLLANIDDKLDRIGRMFAGAINESGLNPNKPIITKLH